jgi:glycosyltransferase involved in cell wall biosynthesis
MYPTLDNPNYGVFVKNFEDSFIKSGGEIKYKAVLTKPNKSIFLKLLSYFKHYLLIMKIGLFYDYDVIYVHYVAHNSLPILLINNFINKKIILNVHGDDILPRTKFVRLLQYFVKKIIYKSELVVVPSEYFKDKVLEIAKDRVNEIYISPSGGVDLEIFNFKEKILEVNNEKINISIGFVSRIDSGKGWYLFLDLIERLNKISVYSVKGIIVGNGNEDDLLSNEILKCNLANYIIKYPNLNHKELSKIYSSLDLFIFPTMLFESLGLVGLEAMACGTPVIGSDIGGLRTYIRENVNGFLFIPNDSDDLYSKTLKYLNHSEMDKKTIIKNCISTAKEYDSKSISKKLFDKITSIC